MSNLDIQYISELVPQAREGDGNAFAELFAATHQKQFAFARSYLQDDFLAQEALQDAYICAMKNLSKLREPSLVVVWLNQITLQNCFRIQYHNDCRRCGAAAQRPENRMLEIDGRRYSVRQLMTLPFSESQTLLLRGLCGMKTGAIASLLEMRRAEVRRYMENGRRRLRSLSAGEGEQHQ